jgi:hypothetical protein
MTVWQSTGSFAGLLWFDAAVKQLADDHEQHKQAMARTEERLAKWENYGG